MSEQEKIDKLEAQVIAHRYMLAVLLRLLPPQTRDLLKTMPQPFEPDLPSKIQANEEFDRILGIATNPSAFEGKPEN